MDAEQLLLQWLAEYKNLIYRVVLSYSADTSGQEDLFQEITLALWRSIPNFKGQAKASTWIYRVALNTAIDQLRKRSRRPGFELFEDKSHWVEFDEPNEEMQMVFEQIRLLNNVDRSLLLLYLDGVSYHEIAEILGVPASSVGVKLNRAKEKLKSAINTQVKEVS